MLGHIFKMHVTFRNMYLGFKRCLTQGKSLRAMPLPAPWIANIYHNKFQRLPCKILGNYSDRDPEWGWCLIFFSIIVTGMYCKCYTSLFCFSSIKQGTPVFFKDWLCEYVHKKKWKHCNDVHKLCVYFLLIYCNVKFLTEFLMLYWKSKKALRWTTAVQKKPTEMEQSEWSTFFFFIESMRIFPKH